MKNILTDESYTRVLTNHRKQMHERKVYSVLKAEQFRHEGIHPVLIQREKWNQAQEILNQHILEHFQFL